MAVGTTAATRLWALGSPRRRGAYDGRYLHFQLSTLNSQPSVPSPICSSLCPVGARAPHPFASLQGQRIRADHFRLSASSASRLRLSSRVSALPLASRLSPLASGLSPHLHLHLSPSTRAARERAARYAAAIPHAWRARFSTTDAVARAFSAPSRRTFST